MEPLSGGGKRQREKLILLDLALHGGDKRTSCGVAEPAAELVTQHRILPRQTGKGAGLQAQAVCATECQATRLAGIENA